MTFQEAKDQVARQRGYSFVSKIPTYKELLNCMEEAAELYAQQVAKDFFDAGYNYRGSLSEDIVELFGPNSQPDFEQFKKEYFK